jgi:hypothetical protein
MFNPIGPLGPFANKIDLGYLLYMYDLRMKYALTAISRIRNHFAHHLSQSFSSTEKEFNKCLGRLTLHHGLKFYPNPLISSGDTDEKIRKAANNKQLFLINVRLALIFLMRDMHLHVPYGNLYISSPRRDPASGTATWSPGAPTDPE